MVDINPFTPSYSIPFTIHHSTVLSSPSLSLPPSSSSLYKYSILAQISQNATHFSSTSKSNPNSNSTTASTPPNPLLPFKNHQQLNHLYNQNSNPSRESSQNSKTTITTQRQELRNYVRNGRHRTPLWSSKRKRSAVRGRSGFWTAV